MNLQNAVYLNTILSSVTNNMVINKSDNLSLNIKNSSLNNYLIFLKLHSSMQFKLLLDIWGVDFPKRKQRFEVNYMALSPMFNSRIFLRLNVFQDDIISSVMSLYNSANWLEREIWDMYGIFFKDHKDLRRILTDYGFEGFPLRKDFPLTGYLQFRYDDESQTVISEPVELTQEFRSYEYSMPWEEKDE